MPRVRRQGHRAPAVEQQSGVPAHAPVRAHRDGHAEHGRLEHGVQPGPVEAPPYERHVPQRVEIRQDPDAVHHDHRGRLRMLELRQPHRPRQLQRVQPLRDSREMVGVWLVGREQETRGGDLGEQVGEGWEQHRFVGRPGGPGDDGERPVGRGGEARQRLTRAVEPLRALGDAVVARIAGHRDRLGPGAEQLEAAAVVVADRAHAIERPVGRLRPLARRPPEPGALRRHGG